MGPSAFPPFRPGRLLLLARCVAPLLTLLSRIVRGRSENTDPALLPLLFLLSRRMARTRRFFRAPLTLVSFVQPWLDLGVPRVAARTTQFLLRLPIR
uniref:Putative secreted protein n=1 Tax=Ixodes ricinus TaxID=34613 RepID=A0A6B0UFM1_IXORI